MLEAIEIGGGEFTARDFPQVKRRGAVGRDAVHVHVDKELIVGSVDRVVQDGAARAVLEDLAGGSAPAAAAQAAARLCDTDSLYTLEGLADALGEVVTWPHYARRDAMARNPRYLLTRTRTCAREAPDDQPARRPHR